jgi:hypothetical protein
MRFAIATPLLMLASAVPIAAIAQNIPAGTVLPVMVSSTLDARRDKPGRVITGKIMQDVPLPDAQTIPRGTKVLGHIEKVQPASSAGPSQLTLKFDSLELRGARVSLNAHLRALASMNEVYEARMPTNAWDDYGTSPSDWNTVQIGGAGVYRGNGDVVADGEVVGRATDYGAVTAKLVAAPKRGCSGNSENEQALWKFSPSACGTYGLDDLKIAPSEQGSSAGEITLQSSSNVFIRGGSGWLLRVN